MAEGAVGQSHLARFAPHWIALYIVVGLAWVLLWLMARPAAELPGIAALDPGFWNALCAVGPSSESLAPLAGMWGLMVIAMMLPGLLPALGVLEDLRLGPASQAGQTSIFLAGYLGVWALLAMMGAGSQLLLAEAGMLDGQGSLLSRGASAALLALAGLYQFSPLKRACLSRCRAPMGFFLQYWRPRLVPILVMGLRMGLICAGCCWALMALAFVGGTMSLAFMGLATLIMFSEKLPGIGNRITVPLGMVLLCLAALRLAGIM